ncbi:MAG: FtsQ-type POTRA domain-containing protein [Lachnospiraceae bacterium]|jgi:cell division protein FtsQ|nr:FtsQ-type POTRA domain-containing protein [Lachnospiraceae bacterium]
MSENEGNVIQFQKKTNGIIAAVVAVVLILAVIILLTCFKIDKIQVTGNKHYTKDEITKIIKENGYVDNSVIMMLKNKFHPVKDIPFVAKISIDYVNAHTVTVTVYEKSLAGCIEYMDRYVYFDQDGYVLEISLTKLSDAPCITGMTFDSVELHEKLPIKDKKRFKLILKITQLINKYKLQIDSIQFTSENEVLMFHDDIRIELGDGSNIEEQLTDLRQILDGLEGKKGVLNMREFDTAVGTASFKEKK